MIRATAVLFWVLSSSHRRNWIPTDVIEPFQLSIIVFSDPRKRCIRWDGRGKGEKIYEISEYVWTKSYGYTSTKKPKVDVQLRLEPASNQAQYTLFQNGGQ